jgi:hypothetical protein
MRFAVYEANDLNVFVCYSENRYNSQMIQPVIFV